MKHSWRFTKEDVLPLWRWYLAGGLAVLLTNWMSVQVPVQMAAGLDELRAGGDASPFAWRMGVLGLLIIVARTFSRVWFFTPGRLAEYRVRTQFFAHLLELQPGFYASQNTGDLLSRATSDVTYARAFAGFALLQACNVVGSLTIGAAQMMWYSPSLTAAVAIPCVLAFGGMQFATRKLMALQRQSQKQLGAFADELLGTFSGVATVQAFCVEEVFNERVGDKAADLRATNLSMTRIRAFSFPLLTVAGGIATWGLLVFGAAQVHAGRLSPGDLAAFISLVAFVVMPMRALGWLIPLTQRAEASLERIYTVLDQRPLRPDAVTRAPAPKTAPEIVLSGLTFAFDDAPDRPVLRDLSLRIAPGATVGIFGPVGSGKTVLLRLLSRLLDPPAGTIRIDGTDVREIELGQWRAATCAVPQTAFLFSETIRENVGFGAPDEAVRAAVKAASLEMDLATLPDGLGTVVGERGIALSGGQRQRVALARGLLRDSPVVLLDDVLSAVDHHTEQELIATLRARKGATRLIVSHRLSALIHTDKVLVLDAGRLVDEGTHDELVARPGPYADAWRIQQESA